MHHTAEYGIAAHWKYKESGSGKSASESELEKMNWLRELLEWQNDMADNREFLTSVKDEFNLFSDSVYCFTPEGDVKSLPAGSTPIDFAYSIHSHIGETIVGAKADGHIIPLSSPLKNTQIIEILTNPQAHR